MAGQMHGRLFEKKDRLRDVQWVIPTCQCAYAGDKKHGRILNFVMSGVL